MRQWCFAMLCLAASTWSFGADYYDGSILTIPMVNALGHTYLNASVTVTSVTPPGDGTPQGRFDNYTGGNQLFIPSVYYAGRLYTNVAITWGKLVYCCDAEATPAAFLIVANPNDQTIAAYPYTQGTQVASTIRDPALLNADLSHQPKLLLDKTNNLLFDVVRLASGGLTVTPFSFNVTTGALAAAGPPANFPNASQANLNTYTHQLLVLSKSGPTAALYYYNLANGTISASPSASQSSAQLAEVIALDKQDGQAFDITSTGVAAYPYSSTGVNFTTATAVTSANLLAYAGGSNNVDARIDMTNHVLLTTANASNGTSTEVMAIPYSAASVGPAAVSFNLSGTAYACGYDPTNRFYFVSDNNSPILNVYSYTGTGAMSQAKTIDMSNNGLGGALNGVGGCNDVDPVNHMVFFTNNNPATIFYFLYKPDGTVSTLPAGQIILTQGPQQYSILSTLSASQQ
jgi:hypothetical protein